MSDDLHLDDPSDPRSIALTRAGNAAVVQRLHDDRFRDDVARLRKIIEDEERLLVCRLRGGMIYDFHRSAEHPRGLWRRLPGEAVPSADADWEPVFDLDAYCTETGGEWAWRGVADGPDPARVMAILSDNGSDVCVAREFDLVAKDFVADGFETPPARLSVAWDGPDALLVSAATAPEHRVRSGWPRTTRLWRRGEAFEDAAVVHEVGEEDLYSHAYRIERTNRRVLQTAHTIQSSSLQIETAEPGGEGRDRVALDLPRDARMGATERFVFWMPLTDGAHPAGSVVVRDLNGGGFERVLYEPGERSAADGFWTTRRWMFVTGHDDLVPWLRVLDLDTPEADMTEVPLPEGTSTLGAFWYAADPDIEDDPRIQVMTQGLLQPPTLLHYDPRDGSLREVASEKPTFDATGMKAQLLQARSADGTMVPYDVALPREAADGPVPIVISAYGGYMITFGAYYQKFQGPTLLERGIGTATAHIRGGGEFGPAWHRAAMGDRRHKAFEDCVAVARDLVARGLAPEGGVGFVGSSNGGLLAAVMATRYPDDFGAIKADVPVTDMLRFHLYEAGAAWIEEYGDPDDPTDAAYLESYSPLHQVRPASEVAMPPVLVDAPSHDDRVDPAHARRFAKRMMDAEQDVLLRTTETGGHGGGETSERQAEDMAVRSAFFAQTLLAEGKAAD